MKFCIPKKVITEKALVAKVLKYNPNSDIAKLKKAYQMCITAHGEQKRDSGEPYYTHPIAVAGYVVDMALDDTTIVVALLHDVIEDTEVTDADIRREFSNEVADLVVGLTKLDMIKFQSDNVKQSENFRRLFLAMAKDIRVVIVKFCDRIHNMKTMDNLPYHKSRRISTETLEIYAPLAERLGMYDIRDELQDAAFKVINSSARDSILKQLKSLKTKYSNAIKTKNVIFAIAELLSELIAKNNIDAEVEGREKSSYSVWKKLTYKSAKLDQIADVFAFRILTESVETCYKIIGIIHTKYHCVPGTFKDYISTPKQNGYRSIHTVIFGPFNHRIEMQVRTHDMHLDAQYGLAAHWSYKQNLDNCDNIISSSDHRASIWIEKVLEIVKSSSDASEFLEATKLEMYGSQIFAFTPKGDIINLPNGATVLDFAFAIHTDIGTRCLKANIGGKIVSNAHIVQNGDRVEIITAKRPVMQLSCLEECITAKAKTIIKKLTKKEQSELVRVNGAKIVQKLLKEYCIDLTSNVLDSLVTESNSRDYDDFYIKVGRSIVDPVVILHNIFGRSEDVRFDMSYDSSQDSESKMIMDANMVAGISSNLSRSIAKCCSPKYGDPIVGLLIPCYPILVHHSNCSSLENMILDDEIYRLHWKKVICL